MADENATISSAAPTGIQHIDSLSANEFAVELDGERINGIFRVAGFTPFKLDVKPSMTKVVREPFQITKMVQRDPNAAFNKWLRDTARSKDDIIRPTRTFALLAVDDGVETRRWTVKGAWISEVRYSDFNSASGELVEETLTIHYEAVEESWS